MASMIITTTLNLLYITLNPVEGTVSNSLLKHSSPGSNGLYDQRHELPDVWAPARRSEAGHWLADVRKLDGLADAGGYVSPGAVQWQPPFFR